MIKTITYRPHETCSVLMELEIDEDTDTIEDFHVQGGCNGNLEGIRRLIRGRNAKEVEDALAGTKCGFKNTSCPDQLSKAIAVYYKEKENA